MYPVQIYGSRTWACALKKEVWVGLVLVGPGDQGLLLGLTVLFPVLLRLPPVGYEPKLGFLRNW